jgi:hypothetical protein
MKNRALENFLWEAFGFVLGVSVCTGVLYILIVLGII